MIFLHTLAAAKKYINKPFEHVDYPYAASAVVILASDVSFVEEYVRESLQTIINRVLNECSSKYSKEYLHHR